MYLLVEFGKSLVIAMMLEIHKLWNKKIYIIRNFYEI